VGGKNGRRSCGNSEEYEVKGNCLTAEGGGGSEALGKKKPKITHRKTQLVRNLIRSKLERNPSRVVEQEQLYREGREKHKGGGRRIRALAWQRGEGVIYEWVGL